MIGYMSLLVLMISVVGNNADKKCYFCEDFDCLKSKPPTIMDCSKQKMSSMNLTGKAQQALDFLFKGRTEVDDPSKYTKCFRFNYGGYLEPHSYLSGCGPEMIGKDMYCHYGEHKSNPAHNFSFYNCFLCEPGEKACLSYPVFWKRKTCLMCQSRECYERFDEVDCTKVKMSSYNWSGKSKEMWDLLTPGGTELDDPNQYTSCVHLDWKNAAGKRGHIWGCAPDRVGKEEYCDYVKKISMENNHTLLLLCDTCHAQNTTCVRKAQLMEDANCYISQDPDESTPKRIMNCSTDKMSLMDLTGDAKDLWDLLAISDKHLDDPKRYDRCFAMFWDHDGQSGFLSGCSPKLVPTEDKLERFCKYVSETAAKNNYKVSSCQTVKAREEPRFYKSWEKPRKCYKCENKECLKPSMIVNCIEDRIDLFRSHTEKFWKYLLTREMMNLSQYNKCFGLSWNRGKQKLWGCAPEYVANEKFCDYVSQIVRKKNFTNLECTTCQATEEPCLKSWRVETTTITGEMAAGGSMGKSNAMNSHDDHAVMWWIISGVLIKIIL